MNISNVSFKGLWQVGERKAVGKIKSAGTSTDVHKQDLYFHPFLDEDETKIKQQVNRFNHKVIKEYDEMNGKVNYIYCNVIRQPNFPVTEEQFEAMTEMKKRINPSVDFNNYVYRSLDCHLCSDNSEISAKVRDIIS